MFSHERLAAASSASLCGFAGSAVGHGNLMTGASGVDTRGLEELTKKYQDLQERIDLATSAGSQLAAQETENKIVLEELQNLEDDAQVYKMVGSVLAKQTKEDSVDNVSKRLKLIAEEIERNQKTANLNKIELDKLMQQIQHLTASVQQQQTAS